MLRFDTRVLGGLLADGVSGLLGILGCGLDSVVCD